MTKQQYIEQYKKAYDYKGLHCGMIFYHDRVLDIVECRSVYSSSRLEVVLWGEDKMKFYRANSIDATFYVDGNVQDAFGDITKYLTDRIEED